MFIYIIFFFFSSRRRHTRSLCDWSSDVCSSDLAGGIARELEHAPYEPRAVVAAVDLRPVGAAGGVGLAAPDIGHADLAHGQAQRPLLNRRQRWQLVAREHLARVGLLAAVEAQGLGERPRRLGARDRVAREQLDRLAAVRLGEAQAELARDRLGAEVPRWVQPGAPRLGADGVGQIGEPELCDDGPV